MNDSIIRIRKRLMTVETELHENGPVQDKPLRTAWACAVVENPYAGRYVDDLSEFMSALPELGASMAEELALALGGVDCVEAYGKGAIVGSAGEIEHGAVWHTAGGLAMRKVLGEPKAIVPSSKVVAHIGYRLVVPTHNVHAAYVRSHFNSVEVGVQDAPRPNEIVFALAMADGARIHNRLGGMTVADISVHDGQR